MEYMEQLKAKKAEMSPEAAGELQEMAQNTIRSVRLALQIFSTEDYSRLNEMEAIEHTVDSQETALINSHVERLMSSACDPLAGVIFSDLVTDFERCSDHAVNLAYALKER